MSEMIRIGNPDSAAIREAGVGKVRSDGSIAARKEAGLITQAGFTDAPTYVVAFNVAATAAMDIVTLAPSGSRVVRLQRIVIVNPGSATAATVVDLQLGHAGAPGSGGAALTVHSVDNAVRVAGQTGGPDPDAGNSGAVARAGDTTQAAGFIAGMYDPVATLSVPAAAAGFTPLTVYSASDPRTKPLTASNAGSRSIVLRTPAVGAGAAGLRGYAEFTVDDA